MLDLRNHPDLCGVQFGPFGGCSTAKFKLPSHSWSPEGVKAWGVLGNLHMHPPNTRETGQHYHGRCVVYFINSQLRVLFPEMDQNPCIFTNYMRTPVWKLGLISTSPSDLLQFGTCLYQCLRQFDSWLLRGAHPWIFAFPSSSGILACYEPLKLPQ